MEMKKKILFRPVSAILNPGYSTIKVCGFSALCLLFVGMNCPLQCF